MACNPKAAATRRAHARHERSMRDRRLGFASVEMIEGQGATVRTEACGVARRRAADDAGATVGYSWTLAEIPDGAAAPHTGPLLENEVVRPRAASLRIPSRLDGCGRLAGTTSCVPLPRAGRLQTLRIRCRVTPR